MERVGDLLPTLDDPKWLQPLKRMVTEFSAVKAPMDQRDIVYKALNRSTIE